MKKFKEIADKLQQYASHNMYSLKSSTKTKRIYKYDKSQNINVDLVLKRKLKNLNQYTDCDVE